MIYQGRSSRRGSHVARSQLAARLGLAVYAAVGVLIALRCAVLLLSYPDSVWSVKAVLGASAPLLLPLSVIPAAQRVVLGSATLADLTAALLVLALPLPFLGNRSRRQD